MSGPIRMGMEPGWVGVFTRHQAEGAIPNGTTIKKVRTEPKDANPIGMTGTVLGSLRHPEASDVILYFVEWDSSPRYAVAVTDWKIGPA